MNFHYSDFKKALEKSPPFVVPLLAALAAFCTYSCMYAFRKPFTAGTFDGQVYAGISIKILFVIAQLVGYTLSKFLGIRIVSSMKHHHRALSIVGLIASSGIFLVIMPFVPAPYNIFCMFLNGIPLGMVWGLVFSYLEGRRATEFMGSILAVSFIFSSGFVKSIGKWLMKDYGITEYWMPAATAALFLLPLLLFVFILEHIPHPTKDDIEHRAPRFPMTSKERKEFVSHFLWGLVILVFVYGMLSIIRDFRDNFVADMWKELHIDDPKIFTATETPIGVIVLACMSLIMLVKDNRFALRLNHYMVIVGFAIAGASTYAYTQGFISPVIWIVANGLGLYLGYIPFNVVFFERLIAAVRKPANVGFLIYIADSFGYLGSIGVLLFKNFGHAEMSYVSFFTSALYIVSALGIVLTIVSLFYFNRKLHEEHH